MESLRKLCQAIGTQTDVGQRIRLGGLNSDLKKLFLFICRKSWQHRGNHILLFKDDDSAREFCHAMRTMLHQEERRKFVHLPSIDYWGRERVALHSKLTIERVTALTRLVRESDLWVCTTLCGLAQRTESQSIRVTQLIDVAIGDEVDPDFLARRLEFLGYGKTQFVSEPQQYALRGGILDVFSADEQAPWRIEFLGDNVVSIRLFDPIDQASAGEVKTVTVVPCREFTLVPELRKTAAQNVFDVLVAHGCNRADRDGIVDSVTSGIFFSRMDVFGPLLRMGSDDGRSYCGSKIRVLAVDPMGELLKQAENAVHDRMAKFNNDVRHLKPTLSPELHFSPLKSIANYAADHLTVEFGNPDHSHDFTVIQYPVIAVGVFPDVNRFEKITERFEAWIKYWQKKVAMNFRVAITARSTAFLERLGHLLAARDISFIEVTGFDEILLGIDDAKPGIYAGLCSLDHSIQVDADRVLWVCAEEIFGHQAPVAGVNAQVAKLKNLIKDYGDLSPGDFVVHIEHGVCQYRGIETLSAGGMGGDFLLLHFEGNDKLYLPVDRLNILQKYVGAGTDDKPRLDKLQGSSWKVRKAKAKKAVQDLADKLLAFKAQRKLSVGRQYSPPGELYYEFEARFPFEETPDQLKALEDVNADLSESYPMDRLICGDVGFGKTEVALRAAMRVAIDGFQVLVVVPTTVLCFQHFHTFSKRFGEFGISVGMINRFVARKTLRSEVDRFNNGQLDILIGTHRALSKDVEARRLGLLIIDEEQRFGVAQKEMLKEIGEGCDILTLTATPIPRTLHMALLGLRDISVIASPPKLRKPVKTYISDYDESLIKDAIEFERNRGGQVFFIHNRVSDIETVAARLRSLVPETTVRVGHGQLHADELERVMIDFMNGGFTVLCCTTIIESGIDIPNVNTLIVNHADRFGLAQLYQIKGRVGRSPKQSFAYFLHGRDFELTEEARKRLEILANYQDLGSGFHIANHDLESRGTGDLLGSQQSGFIESVGFELYSEMLERELAGHGENTELEPSDAELKIPFFAKIPSSYVEDEKERVRIYRYLFGIRSELELWNYHKLIIDRFSRMPPECERIFRVALLKFYLRLTKVIYLKLGGVGFVEVAFNSASGQYIQVIEPYLKTRPKRFHPLSGGKALVNLASMYNAGDFDQDKVLDELIQVFRMIVDDGLK